MQAGGAIGRRNYSFLTSPDAQQPADVSWSSLFDDPSKPLVVDLGCGAGRYILLMAHRKGPSQNYLGLDVHKALLDRANGWAAARGLAGCVRYLQAHAVVSCGALLRSYPGPVALVSVQYPDPQQRRQRHIVGRQLVEALAEALQPGARVYLTSDFEDTAAYMRNAFERYGSAHFKVDEVHATRPVFPCDPAATEAAAAVAAPAPAAASRPAHSAHSTAPPAGAQATASDGVATAAASGQGLQRSKDSGDSSVVDSDVSCSEGDEASSFIVSSSACGDSGGEGKEEEEEDLLVFRGTWHEAGWLVDNPVGAPTEREVYVEKATKGRVYRVLLVRR